MSALAAQLLLAAASVGEPCLPECPYGDVCLNGECYVAASVSPHQMTEAAVGGTSRTSQGRIAVGTGGVQLSASSTSVAPVYRPTPDVNLLAVQFGAMSDLDANMAVGHLAVGYRYLNPAGSFPTSGGGSRHAFSLEILGQVDAGTIEFPTTNRHGVVKDKRIFTGKFGAAILPAYEYLSFDPAGAGRSQGGIGYKIGASVGGEMNKVEGMDATKSWIYPSPQFALEFPTYNPGSQRFSAWSVSALFIPTSPAIVALAFGLYE